MITPSVGAPPAAVTHPPPVPLEGLPSGRAPSPEDEAGTGAATARDSRAAAERDPRVTAFGAGPVLPDPPALKIALRWLAPVGTGVFGLLLGIALASSGQRPAAPVSITEPGPAASVTSTRLLTVTATPEAAPAETVVRRIRTTVVRVTTPPPPAPSTVTETETETATVTDRETATVVVARNPGNRDRRRVPRLP